MGFPAKSYELFSQLGHSLTESGSSNNSEATRLLQNFSLQSFFIYDPEKDPEFAQKLEQDFKFFDRLTGNRMFFLCLIQSSKQSILNRGHSYDFFNLDSWLGNKPASPVADISIASQLLCNELNLDYKFSPYLVFTTDFRNDWCYAVAINTQNTEQLMHLLSTVALQIRPQSFHNDLEQMLSKIATPIYNDLLYRKFKLPIARKLTYFLKISDIAENKNVRNNNRTIRGYIEKINSGFRNLKSAYFDKNESTQDLYQEKYLQILSGELALLSKTESNNDVHSFLDNVNGGCLDISSKYADSLENKPIDAERIIYSGMEQESQNYLKICSQLDELFLSQDLDILDYSFYTINLAKCFETELNHSITQLIRKNDKIEMPTFFYKLKPDGNQHPYLPDNIGIQTPKAVMLNKPKDRHFWLPPGMGETSLVWKSMKLRFKNIENNIPEFLACIDFDQTWNKIQSIRNKTSHSSPVSFKDKYSMLQSMNHLKETGAFAGMNQIKQMMKNTH